MKIITYIILVALVIFAYWAHREIYFLQKRVDGQAAQIQFVYLRYIALIEMHPHEHELHVKPNWKSGVKLK